MSLFGCGRPLRRECRRGASAVTLVLICFFARPHSSAGSDDGVLVDAVQAALQQYSSGIQTLTGRLRWEMDPEPDFRAGSPDAIIMEDMRGETDFVTDLATGRTRIDSTRSFFYSQLSPERFEVRAVDAFDGANNYTLNYTETKGPFLHVGPPPGIPHLLNITPHNQTRLAYLPHDFIGLRIERMVPGVLGSLSDILRSGALEVGGREAVQGSDCWRLVLEHNNARVVIWLDIEHSLVPRRLEYSTAQRHEQQRKPMHILEILEFARFPDERTGQTYWLPVRGQVSNAGDMRHEIEVVHLRINEPAPDTLFLIDHASLPHGVKVNNAMQPTFVTGGRTDLWEEHQRQLDAHSASCQEVLRQKIASSPVPVRVANPARSSWLSIGIGTASVVLLVTGVWLGVRRAHR